MANPVPVVGGNNNTWGTVLNQFLAVSIDVTNGNLITANTNQNVTNFPSLYPPAQYWTTGNNPNYASATAPGFVQLAGDLAGSGSSATAPTLTAITTGATVGSSSQVPVITYDAKGRITGTSTASITSGTQRTFSFFMG